MIDEELVRRITRLERRAADLDRPEKALALATPFMHTQALRGLWVSSVDSNGDWYDLSGLGHTLSYNGNPTFNQAGIAPYWDLDGTGDFFDITDAASGNDYDITSGEAYIVNKGLTYGGWFYPDLNTGAEMSLMSKYTTAGNQRAYHLFISNADDKVYSRLSSAGTAASTEAFSNDNFGAITYAAWYFAVVRYIRGVSHDIFTNGVWYIGATGLPSVFNSAANLQIGAADAGTLLLNGRCALAFVCAAAITDAVITGVYQETKGFFDV